MDGGGGERIDGRLERDAPTHRQPAVTGRHSLQVSTRTGATATVTLAGPVDLRPALERLTRNGDDLLDRWDGAVLRRTAPRGDGHASLAFAATPGADPARPRLSVTVDDRADLDAALDAARGMIVAAPAALTRLAAADPVIGALAALHPGTAQLRDLDLFGALVRAISAQQVNLRWAATTRARMATAFGDRHEVAGGAVWSLDPRRLALVTVAELRALQLTTRKAEYVIGCAVAVAEGRLELAELETSSDAAVVERLVAVRGIGRWTAEWVLARTMGRPVVVAGDLGVRKVVAQAYLGLPIAGEDEVRAATVHWGAAATAAQALLLQSAAAGDDLVAIGRDARAGARSAR